MRRNRTDSLLYQKIASTYGLEESDIRKIIQSFFDTIMLDAKSLPFDNASRIFVKNKFDDYVTVRYIPRIGKIGPVYSRYLIWRKNVADDSEQVLKSSFKSKSRKQKAEALAKLILEGVQSEQSSTIPYRRIWVVSKNGKRLAKQVIPKNKKI